MAKAGNDKKKLNREALEYYICESLASGSFKSASEIAKSAGVGVNSLSYYRCGHREASLKSIAKLAKVLGVTQQSLCEKPPRVKIQTGQVKHIQSRLLERAFALVSSENPREIRLCIDIVRMFASVQTQYDDTDEASDERLIWLKASRELMLMRHQSSEIQMSDEDEDALEHVINLHVKNAPPVPEQGASDNIDKSISIHKASYYPDVDRDGNVIQ